MQDVSRRRVGLRAVLVSPESLLSRTSSRKRIFPQNQFSLFIRGPGGFDSRREKKGQKSRDTATLTFRHLIYFLFSNNWTKTCYWIIQDTGVNYCMSKTSNIFLHKTSIKKTKQREQKIMINIIPSKYHPRQQWRQFALILGLAKSRMFL